jgi:hypothetical protein
LASFRQCSNIHLFPCLRELAGAVANISSGNLLTFNRKLDIELNYMHMTFGCMDGVTHHDFIWGCGEQG